MIQPIPANSSVLEIFNRCINKVLEFDYNKKCHGTFYSELTNFGSLEATVCDIGQQLPVGMSFIIPSHTVHTLQIRAIVYIVTKGESMKKTKQISTTAVRLSI